MAEDAVIWSSPTQFATASVPHSRTVLPQHVAVRMIMDTFSTKCKFERKIINTFGHQWVNTRLGTLLQQVADSGFVFSVYSTCFQSSQRRCG